MTIGILDSLACFMMLLTQSWTRNLSIRIYCYSNQFKKKKKEKEGMLPKINSEFDATLVLCKNKWKGNYNITKLGAYTMKPQSLHFTMWSYHHYDHVMPTFGISSLHFYIIWDTLRPPHDHIKPWNQAISLGTIKLGRTRKKDTYKEKGVPPEAWTNNKTIKSFHPFIYLLNHLSWYWSFFFIPGSNLPQKLVISHKWKSNSLHDYEKRKDIARTVPKGRKKESHLML